MKAYGLAEACISLWLFNYEGIDERTLESKKIQADNWKHFVVSCLLECAKIDDSFSYEQWQKEAGIRIEHLVGIYLPKTNSKLKTLKPTEYKNEETRKEKGCDEQMSLFFPSNRKKLQIKIREQFIQPREKLMMQLYLLFRP